ncbi:MAG: type I secretion system permease/ATPase, partial [Geobacteraceae bacterium]|nr:type I secretion system permease/ATPase [Geobacteraceae bacterium]
MLHDHTACILAEISADGDKAKILLPEAGAGQKIIAVDALEALYTGYVFFVRPQFRMDNDHSRQLFPVAETKWFWGTIFSSWRIYRDVLLASFLINVFALASSFYILNVYDRVIPNSAFETLWVLSIGVTVIHLFS